MFSCLGCCVGSSLQPQVQLVLWWPTWGAARLLWRSHLIWYSPTKTLCTVLCFSKTGKSCYALAVQQHHWYSFPSSRQQALFTDSLQDRVLQSVNLLKDFLALESLWDKQTILKLIFIIMMCSSLLFDFMNSYWLMFSPEHPTTLL